MRRRPASFFALGLDLGNSAQRNGLSWLPNDISRFGSNILSKSTVSSILNCIQVSILDSVFSLAVVADSLSHDQWRSFQQGEVALSLLPCRLHHDNSCLDSLKAPLVQFR